MAFSVSNTILKRVGASQTTCKLRPMVEAGGFYQHGLRHSTTVTDDSVIHNDFQHRDKLTSSGLIAQDTVEKDIRENPILVYMKGLPDAPRCGFSSLAVRVCRHYGVPFTARNILEDPEMKKAVKAFSNWPTFPQIFINGEFVGGADVLIQLHQCGDLRLKLREMGLLPVNNR